MTVGYPMPPVMGYSPKFSKGDIAALADGADNPLRFQISVPIQPGNSGGALLDECGNVVGVVNAKINVATAFDSSGQLPENVSYAIKSCCVLSFLESVPEVKLKLINLQEKRVAEIAYKAEQSSVLILVYGKEVRLQPSNSYSPPIPPVDQPQPISGGNVEIAPASHGDAGN